jgi:toxin YoeB
MCCACIFPEPLVGNLSGYWSRRIDEANRLVYRATDDELIVIGRRHHYDD